MKLSYLFQIIEIEHNFNCTISAELKCKDFSNNTKIPTYTNYTVVYKTESHLRTTLKST